MPKDIRISFRLPGDLANLVEADQIAAGEAKASATIRRLISRGLGNPALTPADRDTLLSLRREFNALGKNLNQLVRKTHLREVGPDFDWDQLEILCRALDGTESRLSKMLAKLA